MGVTSLNTNCFYLPTKVLIYVNIIQVQSTLVLSRLIRWMRVDSLAGSSQVWPLCFSNHLCLKCGLTVDLLLFILPEKIKTSSLVHQGGADTQVGGATRKKTERLCK